MEYGKKGKIFLFITITLVLMLSSMPINVDSQYTVSNEGTPSKYYYESENVRYYNTRECSQYSSIGYYPYSYYSNSYLYYPYYSSSGHHYSFYLYYPYYGHYSYYGYYPRCRNVRVYEYYLNLESNVAEIIPTGSEWYKEKTTANFETPQTFEEDINKRYVFEYWEGQYSGSTPQGTIKMDGAKTIVAYYRLEYPLQVVSTNNLLESPKVSWNKEGSSIFIDPAPELIDGPQGTRYVFSSWYVDGVTVTGNPITVNIDSAHLVEAKYDTQHYLQLSSPVGSPVGEDWYYEGHTAVISIDSPIPAGYGEKWVFDHWSGDLYSDILEHEVLMDRPKVISAHWNLDRTIYYLTIGIIIALVAVLAILAFFFAMKRSHRGDKTAPSKPFSHRVSRSK